MQEFTKHDALRYAWAVRERERYHCRIMGFGDDAIYPVEELSGLDCLERLANAAGAGIVRGVDACGHEYFYSDFGGTRFRTYAPERCYTFGAIGGTD